ncbi:hypothetical protein Tco_1055716 [Tanacetum coccineum]|uniref:Uncharacterized protein n=1 Tax=Tanacetum coccineum TaxID=301880 RepID=A0ABQ5H1N0_9ASTR
MTSHTLSATHAHILLPPPSSQYTTSYSTLDLFGVLSIAWSSKLYSQSVLTLTHLKPLGISVVVIYIHSGYSERASDSSCGAVSGVYATIQERREISMEDWNICILGGAASRVGVSNYCIESSLLEIGEDRGGFYGVVSVTLASRGLGAGKSDMRLRRGDRRQSGLSLWAVIGICEHWGCKEGEWRVDGKWRVGFGCGCWGNDMREESVSASVVTTTALSTTFAYASSVPPITIEDYEIVDCGHSTFAEVAFHRGLSTCMRPCLMLPLLRTVLPTWGLAFPLLPHGLHHFYGTKRSRLIPKASLFCIISTSAVLSVGMTISAGMTASMPYVSEKGVSLLLDLIIVRCAQRTWEISSIQFLLLASSLALIPSPKLRFSLSTNPFACRTFRERSGYVNSPLVEWPWGCDWGQLLLRISWDRSMNLTVFVTPPNRVTVEYGSESVTS